MKYTVQYIAGEIQSQEVEAHSAKEAKNLVEDMVVMDDEAIFFVSCDESEEE